MRYVAHIPLIGGFAIANQNITKTPPIAVTSYSPFEGNDSLYLRYLKKHNIEVPYIQLDKIEDASPKNMQHLIGKLDFASGIPPCSGLSMSGNLKKGARGSSPVNDWMYKSAEFMLGTLKPTIYVFENAPTLYTDAGLIVRKQLMKIAESNGYAGTFYKTDTLLHGIPQRRPRTYTIFHKGNQAPILEYFHKQSPTTAEYLKQIPENATLQDKYFTKEPFIKDFEIVKFVKQKYGENWRQEFLNMRDHLSSYGFLDRNGLLEEYQEFVGKQPDAHPNSIKDIAHVIKKLAMGKNFRLSHRVLIIDKDFIYAVVGEMMERNVHPTEDRRMNIREYLWLMGMPMDFDLNEGEFGKIPQNCPMSTNEFITKEVIAIIEGKRQFSSQRFEMQNNITNNKLDKHNTIKLF
jgi:site-specific DNA-cytosine methylase